MALWTSLLALAIALLGFHHFRPAHVWVVAPPILFVLAFFLVTWAQLHSPPLFGESHPIWIKGGELLRAELRDSISVSQLSRWPALGPTIVCFLSFVASFLVGLDRRMAWVMLIVVAGSSSAYAFYGVLQLVFGGSGDGLLTGPFVNRNNAATYFGTGVLVSSMLMLSEVEFRLRGAKLGLKGLAAALMEVQPWRVMLAGVGFVLCISAVFLTLSRAGVLLTLGTFSFCVATFTFRQLSGSPRLPLVASILVLGGAIFFEMWGGGVAYRIGMEGLSDNLRGETYRSTLAIISEFPLLGTGLGSFEEVFPAYRSPSMRTGPFMDRAHSTPLEFAAEMGLPLSCFAALVWLGLGARLVRGAFERKRDALVVVAGLGTGLLGTLHSFVDFPLQIPGYGIVWAALVATALAQSSSSPRELQA